MSDRLRNGLYAKEIKDLQDNIVLDSCSCICGWSGYVSECEEGIDSEGGEYSDYIVHFCPNVECRETIEDYFPSAIELKRCMWR